MRAWIVALCLLAMIFSAGSANAGGRVALVIGNGAYKNVPKLENPAGDARAMAALLKSVGFDVTEAIDLARDRMTARLLEFSKNAAGADIAIFYFAGQGIAVDDTNYALPVDADIKPRWTSPSAPRSTSMTRSNRLSTARGISSEVAPQNSPVGGMAISRRRDQHLRLLVGGRGVSGSAEWGWPLPVFCGGLSRGRDRHVRVGDSSSPRFG